MISLNINQKSYNIDADPEMPLLWAIRDLAGLTGTKFGLVSLNAGPVLFT